MSTEPKFKVGDLVRCDLCLTAEPVRITRLVQEADGWQYGHATPNGDLLAGESLLTLAADFRVGDIIECRYVSSSTPASSCRGERHTVISTSAGRFRHDGTWGGSESPYCNLSEEIVACDWTLVERPALDAPSASEFAAKLADWATRQSATDQLHAYSAAIAPTEVSAEFVRYLLGQVEGRLLVRANQLGTLCRPDVTRVFAQLRRDVSALQVELPPVDLDKLARLIELTERACHLPLGPIADGLLADIERCTRENRRVR